MENPHAISWAHLSRPSPVKGPAVLLPSAAILASSFAGVPLTLLLFTVPWSYRLLRNASRVWSGDLLVATWQAPITCRGCEAVMTARRRGTLQRHSLAHRGALNACADRTAEPRPGAPPPPPCRNRRL